MNSRIATSLAAIALAASATAASAQTNLAPNPDPAKVGVTQPRAIDAENKAVPQSNVGTLVRTGNARGAAGPTSADSTAPTGTGSSMSNRPAAMASTENAIDNAAPTAAGQRARHARN